MDKVRLIDLPKIIDPRGNLTVAEQMKNVPFDIEGNHRLRFCKRQIATRISNPGQVDDFYL